jgi:LPXTG-motif cell wall-anchored protein
VFKSTIIRLAAAGVISLGAAGALATAGGTVGAQVCADSVNNQCWSDDSTPHSSVPESSTPQSSAPDSSIPDSSIPDDSTPHSSVPESSTPESSAPETTVVESTTSVEKSTTSVDESTTSVDESSQPRTEVLAAVEENTGAGQLAATGSDSGALSLVGLAGLAVGGVIFAGTRERRRSL